MMESANLYVIRAESEIQKNIENTGFPPTREWHCSGFAFMCKIRFHTEHQRAENYSIFFQAHR